MLFIPSINIHSVCFFVFFFSILFLSVVMLLMGYLLGGRSVSSHSRNEPFESGIGPIGTARLRFSIKFYLLGMCFIIFDAEALYLYIWSIVIREVGWLGLMEVVVFVFILLLGLIYLVFMDVLNWKKSF
ncbi:NADH-quinone oxidoreductase subunit A [Blochmannia endosymbiont of Polyrhachis (Hedomyrma) turneri]|uniref:NADH-quinone oxidoreductase subunit A n=1 Tax=Blochmannia endosymbiont of Polyrhachis (Hedomyrma) turneri TaxID=1505596 RepID=UPI00061A7981|nr:NADH-quinone oxidoreductase subunit A [Blochmannia endosymbiont of Polyrhachis (Hedomyrma) turneri]AKC60055.1 NADH-quinone oxidoreductase subunit A [Blochmannia endosymbiont of Polyrhachis (Hedomyrma) turneri]